MSLHLMNTTQRVVVELRQQAVDRLARNAARQRRKRAILEVAIGFAFGFILLLIAAYATVSR